MTLANERCIYRLLSAVYRDGAFSNIELDKALRDDETLDRAYITRIFYGVLENEMRYEFALHELVVKPPKPAVKPILKMGMYLLEQSNTPDYAAVHKCVELTKVLGKGGLAGFVNAVLRRFADFSFPQAHPQGEAGNLSFRLNIPIWLAQKLLKQYTEQALSSMRYTDLGTHIRFTHIASSKSVKLQADCLGLGYYVSHDTMKLLNPHDFTPQSLSSMVAVHTYLEALRAATIDTNASFSVLDLCAAPGGKSIYLKNLAPNANITACDIHAHRTDLIRAYAKRMGVDIQVVINDACIYRESWMQKFDLVICDVPCSGIGVLSTRPDIILNRTESSLLALQELQKNIVIRAAQYVRPGGVLCYSTCTILNEENQNVFSGLLREAPHMQQIDLSALPISAKLSTCGQVTRGKDIALLPDQNGFDGFYIAAARRTP